MKVLTRLGLAVSEAHLVQDLARDVERQGRLAAVQAFHAAFRSLLLARLTQPDLLQDAHQQLVHVVLDATGRLDELAVSRGS